MITDVWKYRGKSTHNTECCPSCASTASSGYYRNTDRLLFLLTLLPVLILAVVSDVSVFVLLQ
ncbi:hypothetical protein [Escherichia coli]|uniref:hypothetical protein n=1 Tax=Escherichia coli TaxID=562 RepID=UPI000940D95A|nr:hypothetical protein [Escherichia coli]